VSPAGERSGTAGRTEGERSGRVADRTGGERRSAAGRSGVRPRAARVRAIRERLRGVYGTPRMPPHGHPIAELVLTVLSQSTNDRNRDVAYLRLRERFPTWDAVRDAPLDEVEEAIRPGGISKVKSARIQAILRALDDGAPAGDGGPLDDGAPAGDGGPLGDGDPAGGLSAGEPSLDWLATAPVEDGRAYLTALPGVGRKTAACVTLFAYGLRDVPVDTHVGRVGTRLGLLEAGASSEALHDQMLAITPPGAELELHVNLLRHGRRTCHSQRPACRECALRRMCPSRWE